LCTKKKQYEELKQEYVRKWKEAATLKLKANERYNPYILFEKKYFWITQDEDSAIPHHQWICKFCGSSLLPENGTRYDIDNSEAALTTPCKSEWGKFMEEPWETIKNVQGNLKELEVENKAIHKYLSRLKMEEKYVSETMLTSTVVQRLLKQGLSLMKHSETLRDTIADMKKQHFNEINSFKEKISSMNDIQLNLEKEYKQNIENMNVKQLETLQEKEKFEQLYIEMKIAESEWSELKQNVIEYNKVFEELKKEKVILKRNYESIKKQLDNNLKVKETNIEVECVDDNGKVDETKSAKFKLLEMSQQIENLKKSCEEYKSRSEELEKEMEDLVNVNNSLSTQKIKIVQKLDTYAHNQSKFIKASTKSSKLHKISALERENFLKWAQEKNTEIENLCLEVNAARVRSAKFEGQVNQLTESSLAKDELIEILKKENSTIIVKNDELKSKLDHLQSVIDIHEAKSVEMQKLVASKMVKENSLLDVDEMFDSQPQQQKEKKYDKKIQRKLAELHYFKRKMLCELWRKNEKNVLVLPCHHIFWTDCLYSHSRGIKRKNDKKSTNCPKCDVKYSGFQLLWI
jgi:myosin heavy subunit